MAEILLNHQTAAKVINATSTRRESVAGHESGCLLLDSARHTTNASLERWRLDPDRQAIGGRLSFGGGANPQWCMVVGVVSDVISYAVAQCAQEIGIRMVSSE